MPNGEYIVSFKVNAARYIGVIRAQKGEELEAALAISAVYRVGSVEVTKLVRTLRSEHPKLF